MIPFPDCPDEPLIVFENEGLCVAHKPCGLHAAPGAGPSLLDWMIARRPAIGRVVGRGRGEGGLIHRLDAETSGLMVFAKDEATFAAIERAASAGLFVKRYAVRCRPVSGPAGVAGSMPKLTAPDGRDVRAWAAAVASGDAARALGLLRGQPVESAGADPARAAGSVTGVFRGYGPAGARVACAALPAHADPARITPPGTRRRRWGRDTYRTLLADVRLEAAGLSLEAELTRGFRHQVRAHLAWIGLPIDGDPVYGGLPDARLRLHALMVRFPDPRGGMMTVTFPDADSDWQYPDSTL